MTSDSGSDVYIAFEEAQKEIEQLKSKISELQAVIKEYESLGERLSGQIKRLEKQCESWESRCGQALQDRDEMELLLRNYREESLRKSIFDEPRWVSIEEEGYPEEAGKYIVWGYLYVNEEARQRYGYNKSLQCCYYNRGSDYFLGDKDNQSATHWLRGLMTPKKN